MRHLLGRTCSLVLFLMGAVPALTAQPAMHQEGEIRVAGRPATLEVRESGESSVRVTLRPVDFKEDFSHIPALAEKEYPEPAISLGSLSGPVKKQVGNLYVEVSPAPLTLTVTNATGELVQVLSFLENGRLTFKRDGQPVLGLGEGGPDSKVNSTIPEPEEEWLSQEVEFDRQGRLMKMEPRPQGGAYGSRNPVPMIVGTEGWGLFIAAPWVPWLQIDLTDKNRGTVIPLEPAAHEGPSGQKHDDFLLPGVYDLFVFDAHEPEKMMKDISEITGPAVIPPKWSLGYMQSHRTLEDDKQMTGIVEEFRSRNIPIDAVIYLGSGFVASGWNKKQPSFEFNPAIFKRSPEDVISALHDLDVKVVLHIWPWDEEDVPVLHGSIPPKPGEQLDAFHIMNYWKQHEGLVQAGVDGYWPDAGDHFDLFGRFERHQMYYQGPLSSQAGVRPWSLHRNGYLGIAKWGGWVWSGDIISSWKTLEAQIAVGLNHSLSLSPYWGADIGGFFPNEHLTGELYARWLQFGAFCPSFRAHGKTWWTRLPWGWGLDSMGPLEGDDHEPLASELNNPEIEPIAKKYINLRYQLLPYTYTLAWQARESGMPLMRAMWLHYPEDSKARATGDQYLWGRDLLIAPVFRKGEKIREVYLPEGGWYDFWTNEQEAGGRIVKREVDLETLPIYVRAGAIIPYGPLLQYTSQPSDEPTTLLVYPGADGEFTLYEDDGKSLDYLKGEYALTRFSWNDRDRILTIGPSPEKAGDGTGTAPRKFLVKLASGQFEQLVDYSGERMELRIP